MELVGEGGRVLKLSWRERERKKVRRFHFTNVSPKATKERKGEK